jgi:nitroimidazol reductase NimA-like FMN-containing flavoprotein (pyridoxamine 5'-phosphate oxidase superfamily)
MPSDFITELAELDRDECLRLLGSTQVGRIAVNAPGWPPVIRPVTYLYDERTRSVIFRSGRGSKLTALLLSQRAAFEVDGVEPAGDIAWSVIVQGRVEEVTNAAELSRLQRSALRPWVPGDLPHWMRISTTVVSGRRIVNRAVRPAPQPIRAAGC